MYRKELPRSIYCKTIDCNRDCGLFHKNFISTTSKIRCESLATSSGISVNGSESSSPYTHSRRNSQSVFDEIMESAKRKISVSYKEPPLPPLPEGLPSDAREKAVWYAHQDTSKSDTTLTKNHPFWKTEEATRIVLGDSDDELEPPLDLPPPRILDDELDSSIDSLVKQSSLDKFSNPIIHDTSDMQINDSDDDDYSRLDLSVARRFSHDSLSELAERRYIFRKLPEFERSLDVN